MDLYIYSDESGVFDRKHNKYFVFGGLIIYGHSNHQKWQRYYLTAEKALRNKDNYDKELKASNISNKNKGKLFRSLGKCLKFGVVVREDEILDKIFHDSKSKQRYLDFIYQIGVIEALKYYDQELMLSEPINDIHFFIDNHSSPTNALYEMNEGLEELLKNGYFNHDFTKYYPPLYESINHVYVNFCDSKATTLVRASDIVANHLLHEAIKNDGYNIDIRNMHIVYFPRFRQKR